MISFYTVMEFTIQAQLTRYTTTLAAKKALSSQRMEFGKWSMHLPPNRL